LLAVVALAAIGCASSNAAGANASPVATTSVDLPKSYKFEPAAITVKAGSTVTWTNDDNFTHSVRLAGPQPLVMKPGEHVTQTFDTPGTYQYDCSFHPQDMKGTVVVTGG
jgi:plastocyanin